jgi:hypothetical protein
MQMNAQWKVRSSVLVAAICVCCTLAMAQNQPEEAAAQAQPIGSPAPQKTSTSGDHWHIAVSPYLWFAGVHGTVGALGHEASVHASAADVLSYFNIGLMGAAEARYKRLTIPVDFMWIKLSDDKGLLFETGLTSVKVKLTQTILTPSVGYRLIDKDRITIDARVGFRYWHLGQSLNFQPSGVIRNISKSANWVDVVSGGKIVTVLTPKVLITIVGDAGGGGANLDYEVAALLGVKLKPNITLQGGWRYLDVDYRPKSSFVSDVAQSGLLLGVTFNVK